MITIGLPFSDQDRFFEDALKSVFLQQYQDWKMILVGDGPSRRCIELARIAGRDSRVEFLLDGDRRGLAARLNEIARRSDTEYLFRMDADDVMTPERLGSQLKALSDGGFDVVGSRAYGIDGESKLLGSYKENALPEFPTTSLESNLFSHPTVAGRSTWFKNNPYREEYRRAEDKELWLRTMNFSKFAKLDQRLLYYRVRIPMDAKIRRSSSEFDRKAVRQHGREIAGRVRTLEYVAASYAKDAAFSALELAGKADWIQRRKFSDLDLEDRDQANAFLDSLQKTSLETIVAGS